MRLIDACQLIENLKNYLIEDAQKGGVMIACDSFVHGLATACKLADTADVIDPEKHGHWIDTGRADYYLYKEYRCSCCDAVDYMRSNFCPNYGAKMDSQV